MKIHETTKNVDLILRIMKRETTQGSLCALATKHSSLVHSLGSSVPLLLNSLTD
jgi:hypothetical protein